MFLSRREETRNIAARHVSIESSREGKEVDLKRQLEKPEKETLEITKARRCANTVDPWPSLKGHLTP